MKRRQIRLTEEQTELIETVQRATFQNENFPPIESEAAIIRDLIDLGLGELLEVARENAGLLEAPEEVAPSDVEENALGLLVPRHKLAKYLQSELKEKGIQRLRAGDVAGRFETTADEVVENENGGHRASPEVFQKVAQTYVEEVELYEDLGYIPPKEASAQKAAIRDRMDEYRADYSAAQSAPSRREKPPDVRLGHAINRLRNDSEELLTELRERGEARLSNPDEIISALASEFAVEPEALEVVLDGLTPEGMAGREALKSGNVSELPSLDGAPELESDESDESDDSPEVMTDGGRSPEEAREPPENRSPGQEGYWAELARDGGESDDDDGETVRARIERKLDVETLHSCVLTHTNDSTHYVVVGCEKSMQNVENAPDLDIEVVDLRTVAVDLDDDMVTVTDNGLWVPSDTDVVRAVTSGMARVANGVSDTLPETAQPARKSATGTDPQLLLSRRLSESESDGQHTDRMDREPGVSPSRAWGYGAGPPPEAVEFADRLGNAGLEPSEHLTRLTWGKKEPMDRRERPLDELTGNYGVESQARDVGLVMVDVDYPEEFDGLAGSLPDTLEVSSPHGSDERRHIILRCEQKQKVAKKVGGWAIQALSWGDLWLGDRYVVGPGSQLSAYGCDTDGFDVGEEAACPECSDPDGGYYCVVNDTSIATVEADEILELIRASDGFEVREEPSSPEPPESDDDGDDDGDGVPTRECDNCGESRPLGALDVFEVRGEERAVCSEGCA